MSRTFTAKSEIKIVSQNVILTSCTILEIERQNLPAFKYLKINKFHDVLYRFSLCVFRIYFSLNIGTSFSPRHVLIIFTKASLKFLEFKPIRLVSNVSFLKPN